MDFFLFDTNKTKDIEMGNHWLKAEHFNSTSRKERSAELHL